MNPSLKLDPSSRRAFIMRAAKTTLGVSLLAEADQAFGASSAVPPNVKGRAKSVIYLYMGGGMSHIDTFDPKTGDTKGAKDLIKTNVGGIQFGGYMTRLAKHADKMSIIRSTTTKNGVHGPASYLMHTAYEERGTIVHPTLGPWARHFKGPSHKTLPSSVVIGQGTANAGFFPPAYSPVPISDPEKGLQSAETGLDGAHFNRRLNLTSRFDQAFLEKFRSAEVKAYTELYDETVTLLASKELEAFDLKKENAPTRERYGRGFGQSCLLARRLVQAGVRFVEVYFGGWDMHAGIDDRMNGLGTALDQGMAALLEDLQQQGLLESTLVVVGTEFGRTPGINENSGRDHHPRVFSTVFAGGGVKGGYVHGASDDKGYAATESPVTVQDFIATIGAAMALPVHEVVMSPSGRPFTIGDRGNAVAEIFV
ncbi:DUF1501 domain-containing protein [Phragmitibacter flavus]|uniref:DUF1501 domain-containing protein n=1 Tax=Phragmitibacter flavus TaxID=2576071 RepID=A0A5R8K8K2_9BACT|nr:DUF1501 domain-containing protein [Phragmitibacter flavus]TLD68631.1 DUF1501 domain-containing protein [Phragmitibacter flavus]